MQYLSFLKPREQVFLEITWFFFQVILDVVYNHTNEGDDKLPYTTSFRGIDNKVSYVLLYFLLR